jgi:thiol-disulfide isomerase/thioredoxin
MKTLLASLALLAAAASLQAAESGSASAQLSQFKLGAHITGPQITLEQAAGKAVLIECWGVHCPPCLTSLPDIEKIAKRHKDKLVVFGAHCQGGPDEAVKEVVKKNKLSYTITNNLTAPVRTAGIPRAYVFNPAGEMLFMGSPFDKEFERSVRKATQGASTSTSSGSKPSGLDALKRPGTP